MKPKRWVIRKGDSEVTKILIMAKRRIKDRKHWTTGAFARNAQGAVVVSTRDITARQWCAVGSLYATAGGDTRLAARAAYALRDAIIASSPSHGLAPYTPYVNDTLGHDAVMDLYDQAIEHSRQ